jgi:hypothetical protein
VGDKSAVVGHNQQWVPFIVLQIKKVYIDTAFFKDMRQQMGISGEQNQTEFRVKIKQGILHRLMSLHMKLDIIFKLWVSLVKCNRLVHKQSNRRKSVICSFRITS